MKITINIKDNKVGFFLELLQSFDFISIERTDEENANLSEAHKKLLDERLANYQSDPDNLLDWDDVKKDLEEGLK